MDAPKASYSITLKAKVLGGTRAGYDTRKRRATPRGKRASARSWEPRSARRADRAGLLSEASSEASPAGSSGGSPAGPDQTGEAGDPRVWFNETSKAPPPRGAQGEEG